MPRANKRRSDPTGVLVLDKPLGMTSMTAVAIVRKRSGGARTGHAGTLDPLATGVLVLALGRATKWIDRLMATDKRYRTVIDLSAFTRSDDAESEREEVAVAVPPDRDAIDRALEAFRGVFKQRPPNFSALKIDGRASYTLARAGDVEPLPARHVVVHALDVVRYEWPLLELDLEVGKGFYVRSLARELGEALGTGGYCTEIRRTAVGAFDLSVARTRDELPEAITVDDLMSLEEAETRLASAPPKAWPSNA